MKTVLVIAYHFPPDTSSGMRRTLKYVKYLPAHGWRPVVLTIDRNGSTLDGEDLHPEIPEGTLVYGTKTVNAKKLFSVAGRYPAIVEIPDRHWPWVPYSLKTGRRILDRHRVQMIYSTCPPPSAHLLAWRLKAGSDLPWVADFRDPWVNPVGETHRSFRSASQRFLERRVVQGADRVVACTTALRNSLADRYRDLPGDHFRLIYNGFDESDFVGSVSPVRWERSRFVFLHIGEIYPGFRDPLPVLKAMAAARERNPEVGRRLVLRLVGSGPFVETPAFLETVRDRDLEEQVEIVERVTHDEAINEMMGAGALVLLQYGEVVKTQLPAKIFEYARALRPILAVVTEGETKKFVEDNQLGLTLDPVDPAMMAEAMLAAAQSSNGIAADITTPNESILQFDRSHLARELACVFDELAPGIDDVGSASASTPGNRETETDVFVDGQPETPAELKL